VDEIAEKLKADYGDMVEVRFADTTRTGIKAYPVLEKVVAAGFAFPITVVNGEPRLAGEVSYEDLKEIIEEEKGD